MGIDIHAFNFLRHQAAVDKLGRVLTIGRQNMSLNSTYAEARIGEKLTDNSPYCEELLTKLGATEVASIDISGYEGATFVADLNEPVQLESSFDTVVDAGSLEHIFDVASAFRNVIGFCRVGGRIVHILPANNLNGHGLWQFTSDLMYSVYSVENGFSDTEVFYASSLDFSTWYRAPAPRPGERTEIVSVEPIVLLSVTRKISDVPKISVRQPFYVDVWQAGHASSSLAGPQPRRTVAFMKRLLKTRGGYLAVALRNLHLVAGLVFGFSEYALTSARFERISVDRLLRGICR